MAEHYIIVIAKLCFYLSFSQELFNGFVFLSFHFNIELIIQQPDVLFLAREKIK